MNFNNKNEFIKFLKEIFPIIKYQKNDQKIIKKLKETFKTHLSFSSQQISIVNYYNVTEHIIDNFNKVHNLNLMLTLERLFLVCNYDDGSHILQQNLLKTKNVIANKNKTKNSSPNIKLKKRKNIEISENINRDKRNVKRNIIKEINYSLEENKKDIPDSLIDDQFSEYFDILSLSPLIENNIKDKKQQESSNDYLELKKINQHNIEIDKNNIEIDNDNIQIYKNNIQIDKDNNISNLFNMLKI